MKYSFIINMFSLDLKLILAVIASLLTLHGYYPYFRDILKGETKPHLYTWLIWAITQGTATAGLIYGGGKFGSFSLIIGTLLVVVISILCFKYGSKNITRSDTITLCIALSAIIVWWQLDNPCLAVFMISVIDGFGYIPTFRKTWAEPETETASFWITMSIVSVLTIISNAEYNFLTTFYLSILVVCNLVVFLICKFKHKMK